MRMRMIVAGLVTAIGSAVAVFQLVVWMVSAFDTPPEWPWEVLLYGVVPAIVASVALVLGVLSLQRLLPDGWLGVAMVSVGTGVLTTFAALLGIAD